MGEAAGTQHPYTAAHLAGFELGCVGRHGLVELGGQRLDGQEQLVVAERGALIRQVGEDREVERREVGLDDR
jgi:hypothetical protein